MMRMMSVDPGTTTCGVAIWTLNDRFAITDLTSYTIVIPAAMPLEQRLATLNNLIREIVRELKPLHLAHEAGFINRFRPQAYGPIYAAIYLIRNAYMDIMGVDGLFSYPPKTVKAAVATGGAGKDEMLEAAYSIKEIEVFLTGAESEHAIDAILIGYTHLMNIREMPEILFL